MALLELSGVCRHFGIGDTSILALRNINLTIDAGEFVAIVGQSGSGKSTLLNILGCLDRPTAGTYMVGGVDVTTLAAEELASLRRGHFGFVFQRYNLLPQLDALNNVAIPGIYSGQTKKARETRAIELLRGLGMANRLKHRPAQLSGGQQQRVSVARALMNGANVILADEPTGALDTESGRSLLNVLGELNKRGHTVIVVTHNRVVAAAADRVIEFEDGAITTDSGTLQVENSELAKQRQFQIPKAPSVLTEFAVAFREIFVMAAKSIFSNRLRSGLTMLGIVIGISSVITIIAVSQGARESLQKKIGRLAANSIQVVRGQRQGDDLASAIMTLRSSDVKALLQLPFVTAVSPQIETNLRLRFRGRDMNARVVGSDANGVAINNVRVAVGRDLSVSDIVESRNVLVIGEGVSQILFPGEEIPVGQQVLVGEVPFTIVGVTTKGGGFVQSNGDGGIRVWVPYTTALTRIHGQEHFDGLYVHLLPEVPPSFAEQRVTELLYRLHGKKDFFVNNKANEWKELVGVTLLISTVLGLIAAISLLVGGVGVMNIMLVVVAERTNEIGIRMALGARPFDITRQFLIEAVMLCMVGGGFGLLLAFFACLAISFSNEIIKPVVSVAAIAIATGTCTLIGVTFGWLPARRAALLDPVVALARE